MTNLSPNTYQSSKGWLPECFICGEHDHTNGECLLAPETQPILSEERTEQDKDFYELVNQ
jgi:hypothetical protein